MICPNCGRRIADNSKFCKFCGEPIRSSHNKENNVVHSAPAKSVSSDTKTHNKNNKNAAVKATVATIVFICIFALIIIIRAFNTDVQQTNADYTSVVQAEAQVKSTPTIKDTVNPKIAGTWRDEKEYSDNGNHWAQYEVIIDLDKENVWINAVEDTTYNVMFGPDKIESFGPDYVSSGGFVFTYKDGDVLDVNSTAFTNPPLKRYSADTSNTAFGASKSDYNKANNTSSAEISESDAFTVAVEMVRDQLKAPSTAKFCRVTEASYSYDSSTQYWTVKGWVDAQNSFGAMLRTNFTVTFQEVKNGNNVGGQHGKVILD